MTRDRGFLVICGKRIFQSYTLDDNGVTLLVISTLALYRVLIRSHQRIAFPARSHLGVSLKKHTR